MLVMFTPAARCGAIIRNGRLMRATWRVAALLALAMAPAALAPAAHAESETKATAKASYFKLANGMEVVVVPNHRVPIVSHTLVYKAGAAEDPDDQPGVAHFLEHLM